MEARGILDPGSVGRRFSLQRPAPPPDLAAVLEHHWLVRWDLRGQADHRSEVLPHPCVHLVLEPDSGSVYGVWRTRYTRRLHGAGWALGTKFHPGGFRPLSPRPPAELTDRVVTLAELFGPDGARLQRACLAERDPAAAMPILQAFLRARLPDDVADDPRLALVRSLAATMATAPPGTRVADIARMHGLSTRTVQRLFAADVGVSPKWVLQRYRLHEALAQMHAAAGVDWARFALDLGYYDQAHFVRDFRSLVGRTPLAYERAAAAA